jgi:hypothetical protein
MRARFARQFASAAHTQLMPTKLAAFSDRYHGVELRRELVLVMGNHFPHKGSEAVAELIARHLPDVAAIVLGGANETRRNVRLLQAGIVPDEEMVDLFAKASVVVLPSHYEGFGLSLLHAMALGKPVVARDIPPTREILDTWRSTSGLFLFSHDTELPSLIRKAILAGGSKVKEGRTIGWDDWCRRLFDFATGLISAPDVHARLLDRIEASDMLRIAAQSRITPTSSAPPVTQVDVAALLDLEGSIFVRRLFETLLGRPAGPGDIAHHVGLLEDGMARVDMLRAILGSDEFSRRTAIVELVNDAALNTVPTAATQPRRLGWLQRMIGRA